MDEDVRKVLIGVAIAIASILFLLWIFLPVKDSCEIERINWDWGVQVVHYISVSREKDSRKEGYIWGSKFRAQEKAERLQSELLPDKAYDISYRIKDVTDRTAVGKDSQGNTIYSYDTNYYILYTYRIDQWDNLNVIHQRGVDFSPHEPERPYPLVSSYPKEPEIGDKACTDGHSEVYSVTGMVDGEEKTYDISREDFDKLHKTGAKVMYFRHGRFGTEAYDICFEEGDL